MKKHRSKRLSEIGKVVEAHKLYTLEEAIELLKKCPPTKFDQSVDVSLRSGIDIRKSDQQVRGTVSLPNGVGKKVIVLVLARGDKIKEALDAGADYAGSDELIEKIKGGWVDFDAMISTPDMMREVGKLGKVLGPRGLMPTPKAGTVTNDIGRTVIEVKAGKVEFKSDKNGVINNLIGKLSFEKKKLVENVQAFISAVIKARPATAKGEFVRALVLSSTMGPGLKIDVSKITETST
ncbi:MAG TPA: 50S ribosomal protein L1 [Rhabdochlamydiaceae bacterium]|nr:50S ribosomal protein L1 [Rhabdochlamydiaceae bacterium]